jgi:hypothetical protein
LCRSGFRKTLGVQMQGRQFLQRPPALFSGRNFHSGRLTRLWLVERTLANRASCDV